MAARAPAPELQRVCAAFHAALVERVPLTRFSLEIALPDGQTETVLLVEPEPVVGPDEYSRMPIRAVLPRVAVSVAIRDGEGAIGLLTVEHSSRELEAGTLRSEVERVARAFAPALRSCVRRTT